VRCSNGSLGVVLPKLKDKQVIQVSRSWIGEQEGLMECFQLKWIGTTPICHHALRWAGRRVANTAWNHPAWSWLRGTLLPEQLLLCTCGKSEALLKPSGIAF
jgi:hypothetical protein